MATDSFIDVEILTCRIQDFEQQQKKLERGRSSGAIGALQSSSSNRDMLDTVRIGHITV